MTISFYSTKDAYGCFSNFSAHPITVDGKQYPTTEHYFQSQKFAGTDDAHAEDIRQAKSPMIAARLGRSRKHKMREDWESEKDSVMRRAVLAKFTTHRDIREILRGTGEADIVEVTTDDYYWGCGTAGTGKNRLGQILVEVRTLLQAEAAK
jgi:N-glycosidase YbiA